MFICAHCLRHAQDKNLQYSLTHVSHLDHPARSMFEKRFEGAECLTAYLKRMAFSHEDYAFGQHWPDAEAAYSEPMTPKGILAYLRERRLVV